MNVVIMPATFSAFSGIDRLARWQAEQFSQQGHTVTIVTLKGGMAPPPEVRLEVIGAPAQALGERLYRLLLFLDRAKIRRVAQQHRTADVVYAHQYPMTLIAGEMKKRWGTKFMYYNHGIAPPSTFGSPLEKLYIMALIRLANRTIRQADGAVSVSRYLQGVLQRETGLASEVRYPYDLIDPKKFHPGVSGDAVREKYRLGQSPVMLYVGRISPHKGVHFLIEAYDLVKRTVPTVRLVIAGKDTFSGYTRALHQRADAGVVFTGFVSEEELPAYYGACDVYTTGSLWEGFDSPVAEAQACGKPVVAFDVGSHPEVVKRGDNVPLGDVGSFARAVRRYFPRSAVSADEPGRQV